MKWHNFRYVKPKKKKKNPGKFIRIGSTRIVCRYLWWPRSFKSDTTRWLEYAYICQVYRGKIEDGYCVNGRWENFCFSNEEEYDQYLSIVARERRGEL